MSKGRKQSPHEMLDRAYELIRGAIHADNRLYNTSLDDALNHILEGMQRLEGMTPDKSRAKDTYRLTFPDSVVREFLPIVRLDKGLERVEDTLSTQMHIHMLSKIREYKEYLETLKRLENVTHRYPHRD